MFLSKSCICCLGKCVPVVSHLKYQLNLAFLLRDILMTVGKAEAPNWKTLAELCLLLVPHFGWFVFPACEQTSCDCCGRV